MQDKNERLRTAIFKDALSELAQDDRVTKVFKLKRTSAWAAWALRRTGEKADDYIKAAIEMYLLMGACMIAENGWTVEKVVSSMPYTIPLTLSRKGQSPFELIIIKDIFKIKDEYQNLLEQLTPMRRKNYPSAAQRALALKQFLPGISEQLIKKWADDEPSDIAARYIGRNYGMGAEVLKKWIQRTQYTRLMTWLDTQFAKTFLSPEVSPDHRRVGRVRPRSKKK